MKLKTPDGIVKFSHWQAVYEADSARDKPIQVCHKLTKDHLYPHNYQTMNVLMAFNVSQLITQATINILLKNILKKISALQFFSKQVADAMEHYRDLGVPGLADCGPTVAFIRRINELADALNANTPWASIRRREDESPETEGEDLDDPSLSDIQIEPEIGVTNSAEGQKQFKAKKSARKVVLLFQIPFTDKKIARATLT